MSTAEPTAAGRHDPGRLGHVVADAAGVRLRFERSIPFPVEDVWSAVTAPERLELWFGHLTGDPASGWVELLMSAEDGAEADRVQIRECSPPHRLAVTLVSEDGDWPLELTLTQDGGATALVFVHHLEEPVDASAIGPGWQLYLDRLGAVLSGAPVPDDFDRYYPALADAYRVVTVDERQTPGGANAG